MSVLGVSFLLAAAAHAAPANLSLSLEAKKAWNKVEHGVKGKIWAAATGEFALYLDGKKIAQNETPLPREVQLKPGNVFAVRIADKGTSHGFALIFVSNSGRAVFSSNTGEWFRYEPAQDAPWWQIQHPVTQQKVTATRALDQSFKGEMIEGHAGQGCEGIWGDPSKSEVYLLKIVTHEDLME